jgi:FkbM family methyltransferase
VSVIRRALTALDHAFVSPGARLFGFRFSRDYLRIAARAATDWGSTRAGTMHLLGFTIPFPNQAYALFLVHEVFVDASYAFPRRPRPRIIDCGANIGFSVLFFKAYAPDAAITAVEADPATLERLQQVLAVNGLHDVDVRHAAIAASDGPVPFFAGEDDRGGLTASVYREWGGSIARQVPGIRLSSLVTGTVDLLKLDIEGAEYDAIDDLIATGRIDLVQEIVIESHEIASRPGGAARLASQLDAAGLQVTIERTDAAAGTAIVRARRAESATAGAASSRRRT